MEPETIVNFVVAALAGVGLVSFFIRKRNSRAEECDKITTRLEAEGLNLSADVFRAVGEGSIIKAGRAVKSFYDVVTDPEQFKARLAIVRKFQAEKMLQDPEQSQLLVELVNKHVTAKTVEQVKTPQKTTVDGVKIEAA